MKIVIFLKKWPGGVGVVIKSIKREFEKDGHKVICISREDDLKIFSSIKNLFSLRKKYLEIIRKENPDIIYTQDWSMAFPLLFPFRKFGKKHFCCFHGIQPGKTKFIQTVVGKILRGKLVVVGDSLKKRFPKSSLVYNGLDISLFKPNTRIKRITNSIGFANWKIGKYHYDEIKRACEKIGRKLIIAENISHEKMPDFYSRIDTFVSLPPHYAGFNLVWIESMASGVPKIIGNGAGIGNKLPITKVENFGWNESLSEKEKINVLIKTIKNSEEKDYSEWIKQKNFNWVNHINKLLKMWEK